MKIVKSSTVAWADALTKGNYQQRRKELGNTGKLSAGLWELPAGKKSFPFHMHHVTEEALYVVKGSAKVRGPEGVVPVSEGDWVSFPPGQGAHQLINDGTEPFVYLALGVSQAFDVVEYPDTGKLAVRVPQGDSAKRFIFKQDAQVDYFADDKDA